MILALLVLANVLLRSSSPEETSPSKNDNLKSNSSNLNRGLQPGKVPVKAVIAATPAPTPKPTVPGEAPICRVVIENKMDYNYELIESIILRFPLPWEKLGCTIPAGATTKPIVAFDISLAEHHVQSREKDRYKRYFETKLKGTVQERTDGLVRAQFGDVVSYMSYNRPYKAAVGVSCEGYNFLPWMQVATAFCVLKNPCPTCPPAVLERSCWTDAANGKCTFLPTTPLPKPW